MKDPISFASTCFGCSQSTEGDVSAFYLGKARSALEEAKEACRQLEIVVGAREREAARVEKMNCTTAEAKP